MSGIISVLPHLITIVLLWIAIIVSIQLIKRAILRELPNTGKAGNRKRINRTVSYINTVITVIGLVIIVFIVLFLYNPTERSYDTMDKMGTIIPEIVEPTRDEIEASNKEVMERKSKEKEDEAEQDSIKAMQDAEKLFDINN